jgi:hypothetical protein
MHEECQPRWGCGCVGVEVGARLFTVYFLGGNYLEEFSLVGADIGVGVELIVNGEGVDELALTATMKDGNGLRLEDDGDAF